MISWNIQALFYYLNESKIINFKRKIIKELSHIYPYYLFGDTNKKFLRGIPPLRLGFSGPETFAFEAKVFRGPTLLSADAYFLS